MHVDYMLSEESISEDEDTGADGGANGHSSASEVETLKPK